MITVAALFVAEGGCYFGLPDVDPWPESRDARLYAGPWPVVAHPPCQRWGRYWHGGPSAKVRMTKGDDGGCFASALASVRRYGGVLEHPAYSSAWSTFGLPEPRAAAGWHGGPGLGWSAHVEQGNYGHRARKATWLYAFGLTSTVWMSWGPSAQTVRLDDGFHTAEERRRAVRPPPGLTPAQRAARREWLAWYAERTGKEYCSPERLNKAERLGTPLPFRDLLLSIARSCRGGDAMAPELPR